MHAAEIAGRYVAAVNEKDAAGFAALFAEDAVLHDPFLPEAISGRESVGSMIEGILSAFPDMTWALVGDPIEAEGRAALVVNVRGTNEGPLSMPGGEVPATGKAVAYESAVLWTLDAGGRIKEERSFFDATGVAAQLGLMG